MKTLLLPLFLALTLSAPAEDRPTLTLTREKNHLIIHAPHLPGGAVHVLYMEAYCRPGSTNADWGKHTVIGHKSEVMSASGDQKTLKLRDTLRDGVVVDHTITAKDDEVEFRVVAHNPTEKVSEAHWAQPCIPVGKFTGFDDDKEGAEDYLPKCFIFLEGKLTRMPTPVWETKGFLTPGQEWCPKNVPRTDVNPRPLNPLVPSNGLIGCFSVDDQYLMATAWEPYQELFQGIYRCLHSDFRIGGLAPGEKKEIRGKIYLIRNDVPALLARYAKDFPEQGK